MSSKPYVVGAVPPSTDMPSSITAIGADRIWIQGRAYHYAEHAHYVRADIAEEMLAALEDIVLTVEAGKHWPVELEKAAKRGRVAIAKAKGE